jgi:hypothetical protein
MPVSFSVASAEMRYLSPSVRTYLIAVCKYKEKLKDSRGWENKLR